MTHEECFQAWAPEGAVWSVWAKPVLFAQRLSVTPASPPASPARDLFWLTHASGRTAVVVDLPGVESVATGLALARHGYRPVPLFNTSEGPSALLNVSPIVSSLTGSAESLRGLMLGPDAPPAFLLDAHRMVPTVPANPGMYDNRWVVFPQDFPSATFLRSHGVADVVVLVDASVLQDDLAHVLLRWQQGGIQIRVASTTDRTPRDYEVKAPWWFRRVWYRLIAGAKLRRNNAGGFGGVIPTPGGGGYG